VQRGGGDGADALLIEVHPNPAEAWSDGAQQVSLQVFKKLMDELRPFVLASRSGIGAKNAQLQRCK